VTRGGLQVCRQASRVGIARGATGRTHLTSGRAPLLTAFEPTRYQNAGQSLLPMPSWLSEGHIWLAIALAVAILVLACFAIWT
jgi:hypothetical protein